MDDKKFKTRDFVLIALISVIFGFIFLGVGYAGSFFATALTPTGLGILGYEILYGMWFMAAIIASYILRKPGVGIISEVVGALVEVLLGGVFGPIVIISAIIQGLGVELAFAKGGYKDFSYKTTMLAAVLCAIFTFIWKGIRANYLAMDLKIVLAIFVIKLISSLFFTGFLSKAICDKLLKTGVLSLSLIHISEPTRRPG